MTVALALAFSLALAAVMTGLSLRKHYQSKDVPPEQFLDEQFLYFHSHPTEAGTFICE